MAKSTVVNCILSEQVIPCVVSIPLNKMTLKQRGKGGLFEEETVFVKFTFSQQYDIKKFRELISNAECCNILNCGAWGNISRE